MEDEEVLDQISSRLQEDGLPPEASPDQRLLHLWKQLLTTEAKLSSSTQELHSVRAQQANELKEVDNYVEHIRGLLQQRECLTAGYERENEELRHELHIVRQQQELQSKELAELLAQEDLSDMGLTSPSEQVAYLLVERATLLERLDTAERSPNGNTSHAQQASSQPPWKKLFGLRRFGPSKHNITPAHSEEISNECLERQRLERDLEEASSRLAMAHQDIRRLTNELDVAKSNNMHQSGLELQERVDEVEFLRKEVEKLKHNDMAKLQKAREESERLDAENKSLREKVLMLEAENNNLLVQLEQNGAVTDSGLDDSESQQSQTKEKDVNHKRCQAAMEDRLVQVRELERQIQRLRKEMEELGERNEELEALLGEAQNASKEERHRHEGELEGLRRKIKNLEAELKKQDASEKVLRNGEESKTTESYFQMHLSSSSQERLALLEARLMEEKEWRKQLELDLGAAQAALKKDKEALQIGERELKKLRLEINSLQTECQQGKTLIKSLSQVKGEKGVLEEKVAQMERAHLRLQSELDRCRDGKQIPQQNTFQVEQLQQTNQRLKEELSSLQSAHHTLREEMAAERQGVAKLHVELSDSAQKKLVAEGERELLQLEVQRLSEELQRLRQLPATSETDVPLSGPEQQLALQALVSEAQAHIKSQDLVLSQKTEEAKQMKQDLQRAQNLFTSAERELRYEKEKNTDLKRHNTLLEQEKLKLSAELHQAQTKLVQLQQSAQACTADCERHQLRVRELELELARSSANRSTANSLQEELQAERARVIATDKKVVELQQQLKNTQHQLRMEEARADENSRLERDSRDLSDALSALRAHQQEDHITRKLLEQREEELQQQVRSLRLKEATLTRTNAELVQRVKQLDTRLSLLEAELHKSREEAREGQTSCQKVKEELAASQQECERAQEELQQVLLQLDTHVRKYNEKQSQHKTKMRQAKQVFTRATTQRDTTIQKLENELLLANSLTLKEKERVFKVLEENEKLLEEKRELLLQISEAEEMGSNGMRAASALQHRFNVLEVENRQLQDRTVKLSNQVSSLERALRNAQSVYSLENVKRGLSTDAFCDGALQSTAFSTKSSSYETLDILDAICRVKVDRTPDGSRVSAEQGYLNLASPLVPPDVKDVRDAPDDSAKG
ncbi:uncharacterized protein ccdc30 isoform 1-T1 [Synchiropus picturatus]